MDNMSTTYTVLSQTLHLSRVPVKDIFFVLSFFWGFFFVVSFSKILNETDF